VAKVLDQQIYSIVWGGSCSLGNESCPTRGRREARTYDRWVIHQGIKRTKETTL